MTTVTLYQFTLCPFCNKVRAALELKGIDYETVEVSPRTKVELPELPDEAPRKVPVLRIGDQVLYDSTDILMALDGFFPETTPLLPDGEEAEPSAIDIEAWVDDEFIKALPTVIYGTWGNAARAARTIGKASKFGFFQGMGVKIGGPAVMRLVAGRLLKKAGRSDGHAWIAECLDQFETWLGDSDYVCGDVMTVADVAMLGGITCVEEFPIHADILKRPKLSAWHSRMLARRAQAAA